MEVNQGSGLELPLRIRGFNFSCWVSFLDKPLLVTGEEVGFYYYFFEAFKI